MVRQQAVSYQITCVYVYYYYQSDQLLSFPQPNLHEFSCQDNITQKNSTDILKNNKSDKTVLRGNVTDCPTMGRWRCSVLQACRQAVWSECTVWHHEHVETELRKLVGIKSLWEVFRLRCPTYYPGLPRCPDSP